MLGEIYYQNKFLSDDECLMLIDHFKTNSGEAIRPAVGYPPNSKVDFTLRTSKVLFINPSEDKFTPIVNRVVDVVRRANEDMFLFDINFAHFYQEKNKTTWITEYDGAEKAHWSKQQRVNWISNHMQYKLCASLVLSDPKDYEGGDILLYFGTMKDLPNPTELRSKGLLYVYPAFRYAQINPVLSGYKYHLDFNFSGPHWK
jgi:hypothetical protein